MVPGPRGNMEGGGEGGGGGGGDFGTGIEEVIRVMGALCYLVRWING